MKRFASGIAIVSLFALLLTGCGGSSSAPAPAPAPGSSTPAPPAKDTSPITIGFVNDLTGDIAPYGTSMKSGTELAVEAVNKNGGINGRQLNVTYVDDQSKLDQAVAATHKLIDQDKVKVIIGSSASSFTLAMVPITQEAKVLHLAPISTNPKLANAGKYFFALMPDDNQQGAAWVDAAGKMGIKEAAVVYINNDYGNGVKDVFSKAFTAAGGKVVATIGYNEGNTNFQSEAQQLKDSGAKYTFIVSHIKEGALFTKQSADLGVKTQFIGDTALQTDDLQKQAGAAAEGFLALSVGNHSQQQYQDFLKAWDAKYHSKPTIWADFAYDTVMAAVEGLKASTTDTDKMSAAIAALNNFSGTSGSISFNPDHFRKASNSFTLYKVQGGQWVESK